MADVKWTKEDVIRAFNDALTGDKPGLMGGIVEALRRRIPGGGNGEGKAVELPQRK
jgi:hypothetical protein|tara:strand:+ start:1488 stop:1655 length:168 start_codon:yes stop_codon:yes gene_type:complete